MTLTQFQIDKIRKESGLAPVVNGSIQKSLSQRLGITETAQPAPIIPKEDPNDFLKLKSNENASTVKEGAVDALVTPLKSFANLITSPLRVAKNVLYDIPKEAKGLIGDTPEGESSTKFLAEGVADTVNNLAVKPLRGVGNTILGAFQELVQKTTGVDLGDEDAKEAINVLGEHLLNNKLEDATTVVAGIKKLVTENPEQLVPILTGVNQTLSKVKGKPVDVVSDIAGKTKIPEVVDATKKLAKEKISPAVDVNKVAGEIIQSKPADQASFVRALGNKVADETGNVISDRLDTTNVRTYKDLKEVSKAKISEVAKLQDEKFALDKTTRKVSEFEKTVGEGKTAVKTNYVKQALADLQEVYTKTNDAVELSKLKKLAIKAKEEGLTTQELNQLARDYGSEFKRKAFGKKGEQLTSVNAQRFENTRTGLKETARDYLPDEVSKQLDKQISDLYKINKFAEDAEIKVNTVQQRLKSKNVLQKLGSLIGEVGKFTGIKDLASKLVGTDRLLGGNYQNWVEIEAQLSKNLKKLEKAMAKNDEGFVKDVIEIAKEDPELSNFIVLSPVEGRKKGVLQKEINARKKQAGL